MTDATDSFDDDELETWSAFATLLEWLPAALDAQLQADSDVTHFEFGILFALSRADDATLRMSTLAEHANSTLSRLSRAVGRLERRGWVRRSPDPDDGRYTLARLTPSGRRATRRAEPGHVALVRALVLGALTPTQTRQLRTISRKVTAAIRDREGWTP
ncbi:MarR family transcriptional regulator [Nocardioides sp. C4-1]|uniref:MarR family winged helix-turn-helix transcriptional regulator n=1 Tax=Nocardioides sp. C4-1 TaxID=3151851 RepID=UPI003266F408